MAVWAAEALRGVDLGDRRREERLIALVEQLSEGLGASVPQALGNPAAVKAAYRLWANEAVDPEAIREALAELTCVRSRPLEWLLAVQDTTTLDFSSHGAMEGRGPVGDMRGQGLFLHTTLAVSPDGVPQGVLAQYQWARGPAREQGLTRSERAKLPTSEKESQRWLDAESETLARLPAEQRVVTVADREADFFALFAHPRRAGAELLVRAAQGHRKVVVAEELAGLAKAVAATEPVATDTVDVPRKGKASARTATVELRLTAVTLPPPVGPYQAELQRTVGAVGMYAVAVDEVDPPPSTKPLHWLLLTTLSPEALGLSPAAAARQLTAWYRCRWLVERFHHVLKQGCRVERLQLSTAERMERALATFTAVAWGVLWVTLQARSTPDAPCTRAFGDSEWRALHAFEHPGEPPPDEPPRLREMVRAVAKLGGFLARKGDGEPGPQTVWRGLVRLDDIVACWLRFSPQARCG